MICKYFEESLLKIMLEKVLATFTQIIIVSWVSLTLFSFAECFQLHYCDQST